jgi:hypothetical protein
MQRSLLKPSNFMLIKFLNKRILRNPAKKISPNIKLVESNTGTPFIKKFFSQNNTNTSFIGMYSQTKGININAKKTS